MSKKNILIGTVIASSMLISGMTLPKATAAEIVEKGSQTTASFQNQLLNGKYSMATVLANGQKSLTVDKVKELVDKEFSSGAFKRVTYNGKAISEVDPVPTGSVVELSSGRKITVVLYGDVNQDGSVNELDATKIKRASVKLTTIDDEAAKAAADVAKGGNGINEMDASRILRFSARLLEKADEAIVSTDLYPEGDEAGVATSSILGVKKASVDEAALKAMGDNADTYKNNMEKYVKSVEQKDNVITITADVDNMSPYSGKTEKWVGILVKTEVNRENLQSSDKYDIDNGKEKIGSASFGAEDDEILLWFDVTKEKYEGLSLKINIF